LRLICPYDYVSEHLHWIKVPTLVSGNVFFLHDGINWIEYDRIIQWVKATINVFFNHILYKWAKQIRKQIYGMSMLCISLHHSFPIMYTISDVRPFGGLHHVKKPPVEVIVESSVVI
jgi:hypothetical protein